MKNSNALAVKKLKPTVLVVAMSLSAVLSGCKSEVETMASEPVIRPVFIEVASALDVADLSFNGTIYSASRADLSFKTSGRLVDMLVKEGDHVEEGQVIARLDAADAQIALTAARVERDNARSEYQRAKKLFESRQSISKSQFEELTLRFDLAQNRYKEAARRLDDTSLLAPFSGVVSRTFVDNHTLVQSNEVVLSLHDLNNLEVVIDVPESIMTRDQQIEKIYAQSTIEPYKSYDLTLKKYETEPDPVAGTYAVTFAVDTRTDSRLLPGMSVRVYSDHVRTGTASIQIPLTAISPDNMGNQYVWLVDENNKLHKRVVFTGQLNGERVEVTTNLNKGDLVVVSGTRNLTEGLEVRPEIAEVY